MEVLWNLMIGSNQNIFIHFLSHNSLDWEVNEIWHFRSRVPHNPSILCCYSSRSWLNFCNSAIFGICNFLIVQKSIDFCFEWTQYLVWSREFPKKITNLWMRFSFSSIINSLLLILRHWLSVPDSSAKGNILRAFGLLNVHLISMISSLFTA